MRILLADDQPEVRSALRLIIEQLVGYTVAGVAADGPALLHAVAEQQPDVVLLDWELPSARVFSEQRGWTYGAVDALRALAPSVRVIALSVRPDASAEAFAAGADGFVCKGDPPRKLIEALDRLER
jgi:DNA-binding NarL/FixJ family response regulator